MHLIRKLITRFDLIEFCARIRAPALAALLARALSRTIDRQSHHNVLCIGRPIFDEDIEELAKYGGTLNYLIVPKFVFVNIFNHFLPQLLLSHAKYHEIQGYEHEKLQCRTFFEAFLVEFRRAVRIDVIVTANYNYSWQQELAVAARNLGIPFVVLFKEGISPLFAEGVSPQKAYDVMVTKYTNRLFIGDRLLVYNDRIKDAFSRLNIAGIEAGTVTTVGIPRFDRYFRLDSVGSSIVFFSFDFEDKARHLGLTADEFHKYLAKTREFHVEVMRFAAAHPDLRVIIKTKNNVKYLRYVQNIAAEEGFADLANLTLTNQGNVYDLINDARAVIGYNSTALLEAFAARRIVMSPDFRWGPVRDYFDEYPNLPNYVATAEDIAEVLSATDRGRSLNDPALNSLLHQRIHIPDGKASVRAEAAIARAIIASSDEKPARA
ncbi:MAG: hypothetical protein K9J74_00475 [Sulfuritalea sp.]|nr:hypothetical protein [Sulfuritalea sp.]